MTRSYYDALPSKFEAVGNGSYVYRWSIKKEPIPATDDGSEEHQDITDISQTQFSCYEVIVWATVTSDKITEAVISALWPQSYEQKLINEYNAAILGIYGATDSSIAQSHIGAYRDFLSERKAIKTQIDLDCKELNIA